MEFKIEQLTDESQKYVEITNSKDCLNNVKAFSDGCKVKVDYNTLMLSTCLYGSTKKETLEIQKNQFFLHMQ